jgi:hypothetical protein
MNVNGDVLITPIDIKAEIALLNHKGSIIIVEGGKDARLFKKFFDNCQCITYPAYGKKNVIEVMPLLHRYKGILGIVDSDFSRIDGLPCPSPNLIRTDSHDIETMILHSRALESILSEYADQSRLDVLEQQRGKELRQILLESAQYIGYLVYYSNKKAKNWSFEALPFSQFIVSDTLEVDKKNLIETLKKNNPSKIIEADLLLDELNNYNPKDYDPWQMCRGHDLVNILFIGLTQTFVAQDRPPVSHPQVLESHLRVAFSDEVFKNSNLYSDIRSWETSNQPFIILNPCFVHV